MADVHAMAMQARDELFDDVKELTDADVAVMTCCDPWTVKHLVAHTTALGNQSFPNFAVGMLKARGNFDKFVNTDMQKYMKINVGQDVPEQLHNDLDLEHQAVPRLNKGIEVMRTQADNGTRALLEQILRDEEEHVDWLEAQLHQVKEMGAENYLAQQIEE